MDELLRYSGAWSGRFHNSFTFFSFLASLLPLFLCLHLCTGFKGFDPCQLISLLLGHCKAETPWRRAWQRKAAHLMAARKQKPLYILFVSINIK
jgi:hypothetical protein